MTVVGSRDRAASEDLCIKLVFAALAVLMPAVALWVHQTDDALLRVDSFVGAVAQVAFFSFPAVLAYLAFGRRRIVVIGEGIALLAALTAMWWSVAVSWHSTSSIGPFGLGWILLPTLIIGVRVVVPSTP
jgi:hypothetical protein